MRIGAEYGAGAVAACEAAEWADRGSTPGGCWMRRDLPAVSDMPPKTERLASGFPGRADARAAPFWRSANSSGRRAPIDGDLIQHGTRCL